ncbi:hypothetical protein AMBLS11_15340 [Alteromonas macleodii str. 'Black Sea 11']|nr:hypothetical protein AMBLS11_15340 [Alteromonas macleodii str. 'Black Sea 11']
MKFSPLLQCKFLCWNMGLQDVDRAPNRFELMKFVRTNKGLQSDEEEAPDKQGIVQSGRGTAKGNNDAL